MTTSENITLDEIHGCIVCANLYNVLAVYTPDRKLVACTVTSPGGHILPDKRQPLVACDTHTEEEIATAYVRWESTYGKKFNDEQEDE